MIPPFTLTAKIVDLVGQISREIGKLEVAQIGIPDPKLRKQNQIKTIYSTLAIEGNTLSMDQITAVLDGKRVMGPQTEILEVKNAISLYLQKQNLSPHSTRDILKAHGILMNSILKSAGKFRSKNVGVLKGKKVSHLAPPHRRVPELIKQLFEWSKKEKDLHPLVKSCVVHYEIEFIHPFEDGNGRIGRFWQSLVLSRFERVFDYLPIESLIKENQKKYYDTLEVSDKKGESTDFIEFMLQLILKAILNYSESISGVSIDFEARMEQAKKHFEQSTFSRKEYMGVFKNISTSTASRDLKSGADMGRLKKSGRGNQTRYSFK